MIISNRMTIVTIKQMISEHMIFWMPDVECLFCSSSFSSSGTRSEVSLTGDDGRIGTGTALLDARAASDGRDRASATLLGAEDGFDFRCARVRIGGRSGAETDLLDAVTGGDFMDAEFVNDLLDVRAVGEKRIRVGTGLLDAVVGGDGRTDGSFFLDSFLFGFWLMLSTLEIGFAI